MGMHEIDDLFSSSAEVIRRAKLAPVEESLLLGNLGGLVPLLELDATFDTNVPCPSPSLHVYELGLRIMRLAASQHDAPLIYDWCAFLLNFWSHMPEADAYSASVIKADYFPALREIYFAHDFSSYEPKHRTLTIYSKGEDWFGEEHDALVRAFFS